MSDPDALLRQLSKHQDYQPLDSTGTPHNGHNGHNGQASSEHVDSVSKRHALTVRLEPDRYQRFKTLTRVGGRTNQEILLDALNNYLDAQTGSTADTEHSAQTPGEKRHREDAVMAIAVELGVIRALVEKLLADQQNDIDGETSCPTV